MNQINIKEYFKTEKEKLRLAVIEHDYEPPSLTIVDGDVGNQIYIKKKIDYLDDCGFDYTGKTAVVLGRSDIVGEAWSTPVPGELQTGRGLTTE